jgi:hypothetical protein
MIQRASGTLKSVVQTHLEALRVSSRLSTHFRENFQPMAIDVKPERVIEVLYKAGIKCVLMGTHAINTYRDEARATQDVDVLVRKKDLHKTVEVLSKSFPDLLIKESSLVTRFVDPATQKVVLDVMKPTQGVLRVIFRYTLPVGNTHRIPDLEMALVSKFAAMNSPLRRRDKKLLDAGDFANVVFHNRQDIDLKKLERLAEKAYAGGGKEILKFVDDLDSGREIQL